MENLVYFARWLISLVLNRRLQVLVLISLAIWGVWRLNYPSYTWKQELTIYVQTPQGVVSGSAVTWHNMTYRPQILPDAGIRRRRTSGEATVVDLGGGRYLFALLGRRGGLFAAYHDAFPGFTFSTGENKPDLSKIKWLRGKPARELPRDYYPRLVTFADVRDPTSVALVDPDDLAATFGGGYALEKITIAATRKPVTEGKVEAVLGWWQHYRNERGSMKSLHLPNDSPRGWQNLSSLRFWSLDRVNEMNERFKKQ